MKTVIIDDCDTDMFISKAMFKLYGINDIKSFTSYKDAYLYLTDIQEDYILITDYNMPDINGCIVARECYDKKHCKKVVILSSAFNLKCEYAHMILEKPMCESHIKIIKEYIFI